MSTAQRLHGLLAEGSEVDLVRHSNPDPDRRASARALGRIAPTAGIDAQYVLYSVDMSHQRNRALVNLLGIDLERSEPAAVQTRPADSLPAFVDRAVPSANNGVPQGTPVDIVIDHVDRDPLRRRSSPSVTGATLDGIAAGNDDRMTKAPVPAFHIGRTTERDALPQTADSTDVTSRGFQRSRGHPSPDVE